VFGLAELQAVAGAGPHWRTLLFVIAILLFGAVGEELLFSRLRLPDTDGLHGTVCHNLPFGSCSDWHTAPIWPSRISSDQHDRLGHPARLLVPAQRGPVAADRLASGMNWALPLFGVQLSGFALDVTGYTLHWKIGTLWSGGAYGPEGGLLTSGL